MRFKVGSTKLLKFLECIQCTGTDPIEGSGSVPINECIITVEDNKLKVLHSDGTTIVVNHELQVEVEENGKIPIADIGRTIQFVHSFKPNKKITVYEKDDRLIMKTDEKIVKIRLDDESVIKKLSGLEHITLTDGKITHKDFDEEVQVFKIDAEIIKNIVKDAKITGKMEFPFEVKDGKFYCSIGDEDAMITTVHNDINIEDVKSTYAFGIDNVFSHLTGEVTVAFGNNTNMWVEKEDESMYLRYLIVKIDKEK